MRKLIHKAMIIINRLIGYKIWVKEDEADIISYLNDTGETRNKRNKWSTEGGKPDTDDSSVRSNS